MEHARHERKGNEFMNQVDIGDKEINQGKFFV